ncbi:MAG TPA: Rne/Rng family ribonuclease [Pyrinomonadaceae bacterium]|nr:Rne/Rng family ribonuclease [Pyrinomonadaceae bacterium]
MSKEMIISVNGREKKIAILEDGKVSEFYIERGENDTGIAGNIYKGKVQRVLPGMQSAFVSIGLERDAFLYVSDFFDEEEEIERIVTETSSKASSDKAKREVEERVERARLEHEKQIETAQELAEPIAALDETADTAQSREGRRKRSKKDRNKPKEQFQAEPDALLEASQDNVPPSDEEGFFIGGVVDELIDPSEFERIIDDEDTGELFKDAYIQESLTDQVRAVEFDLEDIATAEVGSLLSDIGNLDSAFERIADEEEQPQGKSKKATRSKRSKKKDAAEDKTETAQSSPEADETVSPSATEKPKRGRKKSESATARSTRKKKKSSESDSMTAEAALPESEGSDATPASDSSAVLMASVPDGPSVVESATFQQSDDILEDSEASFSEKPDIEMMAARRGGRNRRRGGRNRRRNSESSHENGNHLANDTPEQSGESLESEISDAEIASVAESAENGNGHVAAKQNQKERWSGKSQKFDRPPQPAITDLLREGQEILVQIAKEPIAKKGARITSHIALPGRYLVYMPTIEHVGVSRKIESSNERARLRALIQKIRSEEEIPSGGFIVRTAGIGTTEDELRQDARYLVRTWLDIKKAAEKAKSPALVHRDLDLIQRILRDQLSDEYTAIRVDSEDEYLRIVEFVNRIKPSLVNRVKLYTRDEPILETFGVQEEIDKALKPRVWLKSGGYLVINQTEALVAIDVNTGKFVGKGNARLEDTIVKTNLEAVEEIARQIRLRDLGGIIVLDLIDMEDRRNRHKVYQALQEALSKDKSPTKVLSFNDFGLIIMTRKRVKQSLERTLCSPCENCEGSGWVKSPTTVCYEILAEARRLAKHNDDVRKVTLRVHPSVKRTLENAERLVMDEIEAYLGPVDLTADDAIHQAQFDFALV